MDTPSARSELGLADGTGQLHWEYGSSASVLVRCHCGTEAFILRCGTGVLCCGHCARMYTLDGTFALALVDADTIPPELPVVIFAPIAGERYMCQHALEVQQRADTTTTALVDLWNAIQIILKGRTAVAKVEGGWPRIRNDLETGADAVWRLIDYGACSLHAIEQREARSRHGVLK